MDTSGATPDIGCSTPASLSNGVAAAVRPSPEYSSSTQGASCNETEDPDTFNARCPPPFDAQELQCLPDPLPTLFVSQLCAQLAALVRDLPDDGVDSQALVLQRIIETIRVDGYRSCHYFKDKSPDELHAILQHDEAFSNAIRVLFGKNFFKFAQFVILILRHVCRRPPSNRSRKVQFAQEPQVIDANDMLEDAAPESASASASSSRVYPPFVLDDAAQLPNPFDIVIMTKLTVLTYQRARKLGAEVDDDVRIAQFLFDLLQEEGLVTSPSVSGVDAAILRDCVRRDTGFSESLRGLLGPDIKAFHFTKRLFLIIRYMWYSLLN
ncbi:hypothetical protein AURDEDRAFT_175114 [Auricularia subglabra TFB-10046 SS5]|uniref:Uncharacterized protein n=1 Tax=Auricularia subglabra (strain TFB-10046 / SS5) TaxID=717982 RepID=J0WS96_AURST|nr:hypothetical protein AURDEDRAFT_175114 [Auricularia subglabra TFB-10046 SS5]